MFGTYDVINDVNNRHLNVQMSSVIRQPSTVIRQPSTVNRHPSQVNGPLFTVKSLFHSCQVQVFFVDVWYL